MSPSPILIGRLLQAQARLETLISREGVWTATSKEVDNLKKQLVLQVLTYYHSELTTFTLALQGELVMRYAEKLDQLPVAGKAEEMRLIQVNT